MPAGPSYPSSSRSPSLLLSREVHRVSLPRPRRCRLPVSSAGVVPRGISAVGPSIYLPRCYSKAVINYPCGLMLKLHLKLGS
ncbi:hypothetical protein GUJ93_ZPchr0006g44308 [Zizania palustris]|uniref:Uncharacterized protein n=1 Tax=Zizania palustris TaxID=103762 RepID=A0A8J5SD26_ZIZPA|nr:hypothetical protein GUJ93_ZPchr0006g44308 [Zizania palustris]